MALTTSSFHLDPERFSLELIRSKSCDPIRLEISDRLSQEQFQQLGGLLSRFPDLTITVKDLTHQSWNFDFLSFFPQTRALNIKCIWSLDSLRPISNLQELSHIELGSLLNGAVSLEPLTALRKVKSCLVTGKWGDYFYLMKLQSLERLILSGFSEGDFGYISELSQLKELEILDSPHPDFGTLWSGSVTSIRLSNLRNLSSIEWLTNFPKLRQLKLKSLPKVTQLPPQSFLDQLDSFSATHLKSAGIRNTVELEKREEGLFI